MSTIKGVNFGQYGMLIRLDESYTMSKPGRPSRYSFAQMPCIAWDGLKFGVMAILVKIRGHSFTMKVDSVLDGVSLSQLVDTVTLKLADGSPPSKFDGGDFVINGVDNYRALQMLGWWSGRPGIFVDGDEKADWLYPATHANTLSPAVNLPLTGTRLRGWLQNCGPFATSAAADPQDFEEDVWMTYWVGQQREEKWGSQAIPGNWFSGEVGGCKTKGPGYIELTLNTAVDGQPVTWPDSIQADFYALVSLYSDAKAPIPITPKMAAFQTPNSVFKASNRGIRSYFGFYPPLDPDTGAMPTSSYERVEVRDGGTLITESQIDLNFIAQTFMSDPEEQRFFARPAEQTVLTARQAARLARADVPLVTWRGSNMLAPGDPSRLLEAKVIKAVTTPHQILDMVGNPITPEVRATAKQWADMPNAKIGTSTDNGNEPKPYTGKQDLVPNVASVEYAQMPKMSSMPQNGG